MQRERKIEAPTTQTRAKKIADIEETIRKIEEHKLKADEGDASSQYTLIYLYISSPHCLKSSNKEEFERIMGWTRSLGNTPKFSTDPSSISQAKRYQDDIFQMLKTKVSSRNPTEIAKIVKLLRAGAEFDNEEAIKSLLEIYHQLSLTPSLLSHLVILDIVAGITTFRPTPTSGLERTLAATLDSIATLNLEAIRAFQNTESPQTTTAILKYIYPKILPKDLHNYLYSATRKEAKEVVACVIPAFPMVIADITAMYAENENVDHSIRFISSLQEQLRVYKSAFEESCRKDDLTERDKFSADEVTLCNNLLTKLEAAEKLRDETACSEAIRKIFTEMELYACVGLLRGGSELSEAITQAIHNIPELARTFVTDTRDAGKSSTPLRPR